MSRLYLMVTISNRNMRNKFQDFFQRHGSFVVFGSLARGTANSAILDYFGLEASEKVVTACVVTGQMWKQLKHGLIQEMQIDVAGTGIAFIIPMGSVGGKKVLQFLIQNQPYEKEEESQLIREVWTKLWTRPAGLMPAAVQSFMPRAQVWRGRKSSWAYLWLRRKRWYLLLQRRVRRMIL